MKKDWSRISLFFFFLVALVGTILRSTPYFSVPLDYMNLVHSHSHVAFQGWIYTIMFLILTQSFLTGDLIRRGRYPLQFKLTVLVVTGILISFALQGYGFYSIVFSTLFQLLNYWFIFRFFQDSASAERKTEHSPSLSYIKAGLAYGLLSTLLPIAIGILSAKGLSESEAYTSLVYTFLHLQYNGWFLLIALGLFFHFLDQNKIQYINKYAKASYWLFSISVIPSISLSLLGMSFSRYAMSLAYISVFLLGAGLICFFLAIRSNIKASLKHQSPWFRLFITVFLLSFFLKTILQCLSPLEVLRDYAFHNRFIIIAYLHLSLIGSISFLFIALMIDKEWLRSNSWMRLGSSLLVLGFLTTEIILILTGLGIYYNGELLLAGSAAMALGILFLTMVSGETSDSRI